MSEILKSGEGARCKFSAQIVALFFAVLAGLALVGLNSHGLFDVDEAIFAQASVEMLESGDFIGITYNGEPRNHKPALIYWFQAAGIYLTGDAVLGARLPSALFGIATVFMLYSFVMGLTRNRRFALISATILGLNISFMAVARAAVADTALLFFITAVTMTLIANIFAKERSFVAVIIAGLLLAGGFLAKGPVAVLVPGMVVAIAVFCRPHVGFNFKAANPFIILIALIIGLVPWTYLMISHHGFEFFKEFWLVHNWQRFAGGLGNTHSSSPFYYGIVLLIGFFPWVLMLPMALRALFPKFIEHLRSDKAEEALPILGLIWFVVVILFFSFSQTKLAHYIVPALPGAALFIAGWLDKAKEPLSKYHLVWMLPYVLLMALIFMVFKFVPDLLQGKGALMPVVEFVQQYASLAWPPQDELMAEIVRLPVEIGAMPVFAGASILAVVGIGLIFMTYHMRQGFALVACGNALAIFGIVTGVVPAVYGFMQEPLADIAEVISRNYKQGDRVFMVATHHPSVRFVSGIPHTALDTPAQARNIAPFNGNAFLVTEKEYAKQVSSAFDRKRAYCKGGFCLVVAHGLTVR